VLGNMSSIAGSIIEGFSRGATRWLLTGAVGVGKSRLAREIAEAGRRLGVVEVRYLRCSSLLKAERGALEKDMVEVFEGVAKEKGLLVLEDFQLLGGVDCSLAQIKLVQSLLQG